MVMLEKALANLKAAISKAKLKNKQSHEETLGQVSSYLVFLKPSTLSQEAAYKLSKCLRERLVLLYTSHPPQGIQFAAALCQTLYESKILTEFAAGKHDQKLLWDKTLNALLSGVLDYLEENQTDKCKEAIGSALYATLCSIFFSISISHMSVDLRCTGYSLLSDTANGHKLNQTRLLDVKILGGKRLGSILWRTRDFLVLESILNLFARMVPVTGRTPAGRANRTAFIKSVFVDSSPDDAATGEKLAKMLEKLPTADWEQTAGKIVDVLAASNIAFPQPFHVEEVTACDHAQPTDRLYVDEKGFVANVLVSTDSCDTLMAAYSAVTSVQISFRNASHEEDEEPLDPVVSVTLSSLPVLGREPVSPCVVDRTDAIPSVSFKLKANDLPRFRQSLKSRSMDHLVKINKNLKLSILASAANLEMDSAGNLVGTEELTQRINNISQLYGTNDFSEDIQEGISSPRVRFQDDIESSEPKTDSLPSSLVSGSNMSSKSMDTSPDHSTHPAAVSENDTTVKLVESGLSDAALATVAATARLPATVPPLVSHKPPPPPITPLRRTKSQVIREAVFGASDEELSEVEALSKSLTKPREPPSAVSKRPPSARLLSKARRILDSDDDVPNSTPSRAPIKKAPHKQVVILSDDEDDIEEVLPASNISSSVLHRRRSTLVMTPVADMQKARVAHSAFSQKLAPTVQNEPVAEDSTPLQRLPSHVVQGQAGPETKSSSLGRNPVTPDTSAKSPTDPGHLLRDTIAEASANPSPEPVSKPLDEVDRQSEARYIPNNDANSSLLAAKIERKSVKAALRKKDGTHADAKQPLSHVKRPTRKRSLNPNVEDAAERGAEDLERTRTAKRRKGLSELENVDTENPPPEPMVVKSRAVKRYGGQRDKASSPAISNRDEVDFDRIPDASTNGTTLTAPGPCQDLTRATSEDVVSVHLYRKAKDSPHKELVKKAPTRALRKLPGRRVPDPDDDTAKNTLNMPARNVEAANLGGVQQEKELKIDDVPHTILRGDAESMAPTTIVDVEQQLTPAEDISLVPVDLNDWSRNSDEPRTSTPKTKVSRKSNEKPWNHLHVRTQPKNLFVSSVRHIPSVVQEVELSTVDEPTAPISPVTHIPIVSDAAEERVVSDASTPAEETNQDVERTLIDGPNLGFSSPVDLRKAVQTSVPKSTVIDLTEESPRKPVVSVKGKFPRARQDEEFQKEPLGDVLRRVNIPKSGPAASITFSPDVPKLQTQISPVKSHKMIGKLRNREAPPTAEIKKPRSSPPSLDDIANVLNEINEVILQKIHSKVEGVREDVRIGRNRLLSDAAYDILRMRGESIDRYNLLIELEADYAKFGRNLSYGFDDLCKANGKIASEINKIIQNHARASIPKKAPGSLFTMPVPASVLALRGQT